MNSQQPALVNSNSSGLITRMVGSIRSNPVSDSVNSNLDYKGLKDKFSDPKYRLQTGRKIDLDKYEAGSGRPNELSPALSSGLQSHNFNTIRRRQSDPHNFSGEGSSRPDSSPYRPSFGIRFSGVGQGSQRENSSSQGLSSQGFPHSIG